MSSRRALLLAAVTLLAGCASAPSGRMSQGEEARQQVYAVERAFAKTMADRDLKAFGSHLADETVFF